MKSPSEISAPKHGNRTGSDPGSRRSKLHQIRRRVILLLGFYDTNMHSGIARYAKEANWVLYDEYQRVGALPIGRQADGILGLITATRDYRALRALPPLPLVDLSKAWVSEAMPEACREGGMGTPRVCYNNECIGQLAAEHFIERGFHHIAYMNYGNYWMETERIPAFRASVEAAGRTYHEIPYYAQLLPTASRRTMKYRKALNWLIDALRDLPKPVGVAVSVDNLAVEVLEACHAAGLYVPEEVAVLGCDNDPMVCEFTLVPLSSIDINWEQIGYEGARVLDELMAGRPPPRETTLIPPKCVVTRQSSNILAVPDMRVARAVSYIWEHYGESLTTGDVALAVGLNLRTLERNFRKHLGQGIKDRIVQTRIENAAKLLRETSLKAQDIADRCGFNSSSYFTHTFRCFKGVSPLRYRREKMQASSTAGDSAR